MSLTVYILCYNEILLLPFTISWYRTRFPSCRIVVYDNYSTDGSADLARSLNCEVVLFDTNNQISDTMYQRIKNSCWKDSGSDWNIICDADELLEITEEQLRAEDSMLVTLIKGEGYNMVNLNNDLNISGILHGVRADHRFYDKTLLFKKSAIQEINYNIGAHMCRPVGDVQYSANIYRMLHYNNLSPDYKVARFKMYNERLSDENRRNNWGGNYTESELTIRTQFEENRTKSIKLL